MLADDDAGGVLGGGEVTIGIISYASRGPYEAMQHDLARSIMAVSFGTPLRTDVIEKLRDASWAECVCAKPGYILERLRETFYDGLIYTDADSKLLRPPPIVDLEGADIGLVFWQRHSDQPAEALTGTMYFRNSPAVLEFLSRWSEETQKRKASFTPEQDAFLAISEGSGLKIKPLPVEWCFIFDDMRAMYPDAKPIFEHYQASRKYRHARPDA